MPESRDQRQDAALVALLQALTPDRLTRVLRGLGIEAEKVDAIAHKPDDRKCLTCGYGFVRCRAMDSKAPDGEHHEWKPDKNRSGVPTTPSTPPGDDQ